jgi:hypothetical protein
LAIALTERMAEKDFEFCVFDPEGDYDELENAIPIGDAKKTPTEEEALKLLRQHSTNVIINTQSLNAAERPLFFTNLLPQVSLLRATSGRPHWLLIDEAHHLLPAAREDVARLFSNDGLAVIFITVHPEAVSPAALKSVRVVVALGEHAGDVIAKFCGVTGVEAPKNIIRPNNDEILVWRPGLQRDPQRVRPEQPHQSHKRHIRKYAEGTLGEANSFYFRGPDNALDLRAQNLMVFIQIADGVDDRTWTHHLRRGDYSAWFLHVIKDDELTKEAAAIEADQTLDPKESRKRISDAISRRYTVPSNHQ